MDVFLKYNNYFELNMYTLKYTITSYHKKNMCIARVLSASLEFYFSNVYVIYPARSLS